MNKDNIKLSFVVPFYNEEKIIKQNIIEIIEQLANQFPSSIYELILVNDNSTDRSFEITEQFIKYPYIRLINYSSGPSYRENLGQALREVKGDVICFFDVDLSSGMGFLKILIDAVRVDGFDIAIGSRYHPLSVVKRNLGRYLISRIYNTAVHFLWGSQLLDHQCGFKALKRNILLVLLDDLGYDSKFNRGWFWDSELLLLAQKRNYRIKEIPIEWKDSVREKGWFIFLIKQYKVVFYALKNFHKFR